MSEKGKLFISKAKKGLVGTIEINGKKMPVPSFYIFNDTSLNEVECEVEREKGQIKRIIVNGSELQRKKEEHSKKQSHKTFGESAGRHTNSKKQINTPPQNIYSIEKSKLPTNTKKILDGQFAVIDNYALMLNKTVNFIFNKKNSKDEAVLYKAEFKDKDDNNKKKKFEIDFNFVKYKNCMNSLNARKQESLKSLNIMIKSLSFSPDWRLIVGLGNESVYETSITLHHTYGIPYIPGQAVKGVARNWIIAESFGKEEQALQDKLFCRIFGSPKNSTLGEKKGSIIFFDAYPITTPTIEVDIMNPHYGDYYQGKKPPADYLNPTPIPFLVVGKDTKFEFIIGSGNNINITKATSLKSSELAKGMPDDSTLLDITHHWLKKALTDHGIGAKTAVGYGYFKDISSKRSI